MGFGSSLGGQPVYANQMNAAQRPTMVPGGVQQPAMGGIGVPGAPGPVPLGGVPNQGGAMGAVGVPGPVMMGLDRYVAADFVETGRTVAHLWNAAKSGIDGGAAVKDAFGTLFRGVSRLSPRGVVAGVKGVVGATWPVMKRSALFEGVISLVANGYRLVTGRLGIREFGANVASDLVGGFFGGFGAAMAGAIASAVVPGGGLFATFVVGLAGIWGYSTTAGAWRGLGLRDRLRSLFGVAPS